MALLARPAAGTEVLVSAPMGNGFNVDSVPPADFPTVLIFATGSGGCLSAGRAELWDWKPNRRSAHGGRR